jgi:hypothetical protein
LDALENQLKALMKSIDTVVAQRKGLAEAAGDFSASLHALSAVELSPALSTPLDGLSDLQLRIKELYERQAQQDVLTLGITIDEYLRLIGSVKTAFSQRQKAFHSWHAAESDMQKRKHTQEKLLRQGKTQQDRLNQVNADVADAERKVHQARLLFEDMGRLMRNELQRFEKEKVEDFKSGVETFLESAVEAQKEVCKPSPGVQIVSVTNAFSTADRALGDLPAAVGCRRRRQPFLRSPCRRGCSCRAETRRKPWSCASSGGDRGRSMSVLLLFLLAHPPPPSLLCTKGRPLFSSSSATFIAGMTHVSLLQCMV